MASATFLELIPPSVHTGTPFTPQSIAEAVMANKASNSLGIQRERREEKFILLLCMAAPEAPR
jgi:hypothetical protein